MSCTEIAHAKAEIFKALGHPTRLVIVEMLAKKERCVCEIVAEFDDSQATISRHLDQLLRAGIVRRRRDGTKMMYELALPWMMYELALPCLLGALPCVEKALKARVASQAQMIGS
jgi:ArsR family transcriptional regulator